MGVDDLPLDDKAKRMRDLLSSFYSPDPSTTASNTSGKIASLEAINSNSFDPDQYMNLLVVLIIVSLFVWIYQFFGIFG